MKTLGCNGFDGTKNKTKMLLYNFLKQKYFIIKSNLCFHLKLWNYKTI